MWELLAGSILAYFEITLGHRSKYKTLNLILPSVGLILIGHSFLIFNDEMFHPSFYTLSPIIGVCLIIWFSDKDEIITKILSTKLFVGIGLISYSLYLWHYPIFTFVKKLRLTEGDIFKKLVMGLIILVLSISSYHFIERPFRNKKINFKKLFILLLVKFLFIITFCIYSLNLKFHPLLTKYEHEHKNFELAYDYNNFNNRTNIFIIGNSYADDLLSLLYFNKKLNENYYFYTALSDNESSNYQIDCLLDFLKENKKICDKNSFSFFKTQYEKSDYIILAEKLDHTYLKSEFNEVIKFLRDDKKKFIIFFDDLRGAQILDVYLHRKEKKPDSKDLSDLEKDFFKRVISYQKKNIKKNKNKFIKNNIKYLTRSELYCNYTKKKCTLIKSDEKIYSDSGHLTDNGAKFFSYQGEIIIDKLVND